MRKRRFAVTVSVLLYACATVWWVFHFPEDRALLYRAIPPDAVLVTEHERLGDRWSGICANPFVVWIWEISGNTREEAVASSSDPDLGRLLKWLAHRRTVACYAPRFGPAGWPAWIIASHSGWRGQVAKAVFASGFVRNFKRNTVGIRTWWTSPPNSSGWRTSATLVNGVVVVCISRDPSAARYVADRMEQCLPGFGPLETTLRESDVGASWDHGWFDRGILMPECAGMMHAFDIAVESSDSARLRIRNVLPVEKSLRSLREMAVETHIAGLFTRDPDLMLVIPGGLADRMLSNISVTSRAGSLVRIADGARDPDWPVLAALYGGEASGRIFGLKVPSVVVGLRLNDPEAAQRLVNDALDELNSRHAWGLVATRPGNGRQNVTLIGMASNPLLGALRNEDMPALVERGGWLLFFSNAGAAEKVMPRLPSGRSGTLSGGWRNAINGYEQATGFAWVNFESANKSMRDALAVLSLAMKLQGGDEGEKVRSNLDNVRAWVRSAVTLGECAAWLVPSDDPGMYDLVLIIGGDSLRH